jgi:hypothetical protein
MPRDLPSPVKAASSPEARAPAGFPASAGARVVGTHINGDLAAVNVLTSAQANSLTVAQWDERS